MSISFRPKLLQNLEKDKALVGIKLSTLSHGGATTSQPYRDLIYTLDSLLARYAEQYACQRKGETHKIARYDTEHLYSA